VALAGAAGAAAANVVAPPYPSGTFAKVPVVNVVVRGRADEQGKPSAPVVLFNDGAGAFAEAATAAMAASSFDAGRDVILWYRFRLVQTTEVRDISLDRADAVDEQAVLEAYLPPRFPPGAPSRRTEIALNIFVSEEGTPWCVLPADEGVDPLYLEKAIEAARGFKFRPAQKGGKAVAAWVPFVIEFK